MRPAHLPRPPPPHFPANYVIMLVALLVCYVAKHSRAWLELDLDFNPASAYLDHLEMGGVMKLMERPGNPYLTPC